MSRLQMMALFARLMGLYLLVSFAERDIFILSAAFGHLPNIPFYGVVFAVGAVLIKLGVSLALALAPTRFVSLLTPGSMESVGSAEDVGSGAGGKEEAGAGDVSLVDNFQQAGFVLLGVFFISLATISLIGPLFSIAVEGIRYDTFGEFASSLRFYLPHIFQLGVGIWLLLGAKGLRGLIKRLRTAGP